MRPKDGWNSPQRTRWTRHCRSAIDPAADRAHETPRQTEYDERRVAPAPWRFCFRGGLAIVQIVVRENNVEQALRALKKKMQREGTFREMKRRKYYEKPSEKRARQKAEAVRRARKLIRKRLQREGVTST